MEDKPIRSSVWLAVAGILVVLGIVVAVLESRRGARPEQQVPAEVAQAKPEEPADSRSSRPARDPSHAAAPAEEVPYIEGLVYGEIDLREAKALMPDNLYWEMGSPTKDPEILAKREAERKRRNEEYGKVLAGDANEAEVQAYYDYKKHLSEDYLEFSEFMARRYRNSKDESFVGMLDLATKMHAARLAELPAELADALARSREREKIREDWRRQQEEFGEFHRGEPAPDEVE